MAPAAVTSAGAISLYSHAVAQMTRHRQSDGAPFARERNIMTRKDEFAARSGPAPDGERSLPSRRTMLRGAAGAGVAATAIAATGGMALAAVDRPDSSQASGATPAADIAAEHDGEAIVLHLRDVRSGEIDVFHGTRQVRLHDHELTARIIRASR
jgi:hypothetical protein